MRKFLAAFLYPIKPMFSSITIQKISPYFTNPLPTHSPSIKWAALISLFFRKGSRRRRWVKSRCRNKTICLMDIPLNIPLHLCAFPCNMRILMRHKNPFPLAGVERDFIMPFLFDSLLPPPNSFPRDSWSGRKLSGRCWRRGHRYVPAYLKCRHTRMWWR